MSFSSDTKNELARLELNRKCCVLAEIAGFVRVCGTLKLSGGGKIDLKLATENPAVARMYLKKIKEYFDVGVDLQIGQNLLMKRGHVYEITISSENGAQQILREVGILRVLEGCDYIAADIQDSLIKKKCCKKAYLRGVFLGAGTISDPEKGYHLELVCSDGILAADLRRLINSFGLKAKTAQRRKSHIVYLKEAEQIVDFLNILGAHGRLLEFENVRIVKEMRNQANRIVNCESANTDKVVNTAARQLASIRKIQELKGLAVLPPKLREAAVLRLDHPEATLAELAEMLDPPLKKSGLNHRFRKIDEFAEALSESGESRKG